MKKIFRFEERIPAVLIQCYEVEAETEEEALRLVKHGKGFTESHTYPTTADPGEFELYDITES